MKRQSQLVPNKFVKSVAHTMLPIGKRVISPPTTYFSVVGGLIGEHLRRNDLGMSTNKVDTLPDYSCYGKFNNYFGDSTYVQAGAFGSFLHIIGQAVNNTVWFTAQGNIYWKRSNSDSVIKLH